MPDLRPAVLLDVDGTLLDTNYLHVLAWWQAVEDTGRGPVAMSAIHRAIGIPSDGLVRQLIGEDDEKTVDAHSRRYEPLRENVKPFPRTADLLRACADRGLAVVLATSGQESDLEWMMPAIGAEDVITGATTSGGVGRGQARPGPARPRRCASTASTRSAPSWSATPCGTSRRRSARACPVSR